MRAIAFHPAAEAELLGAEAWYRERSPLAAHAFRLTVEKLLTAIAETPDRWPIHGAPRRRAVLPRFPYTVIFSADDEVVLVIAFAHQKRKPGYWASR